jgi:hypothetical protein
LDGKQQPRDAWGAFANQKYYIHDCIACLQLNLQGTALVVREKKGVEQETSLCEAVAVNFLVEDDVEKCARGSSIERK